MPEQPLTRPATELFWYYLLVSLMFLCAAPIVLVPMLLRYYTLWYRIDGVGVAMGYGFFVRREQQITYPKMQDIQLSQNLLQRWLGIGTVLIQTAGVGDASELHIVGVREYEWLRDYLYERMRGVRATAPTSKSDELLVEIRDALRSAADSLGGKK